MGARKDHITGGETDWQNVDQEFNDFAIDQLNHVGTLLFGRVTYEHGKSI